MKRLPGLITLCSLYLFTILLGLNTATFILPLMYPEEGQQQLIAPVVENPSDPSSVAYLVGVIIVMTALMLIVLKLGLTIIIRLALILSVFMGTLLSTGSFLGDLGIPFTVALLAISVIYGQRPLVTDVVLVFTIAGIGALLGSSLTFVPALLLVLVMSLYDIVAVFFTKHMVTLAKEAGDRFSLMFIVPVEDRTMGLGAGDVALPLAFTTSVYAAYGAGHAIPVAFGGLLGVVAIFYFVQSRKGMVLPAMPPITIGLLIGFVASAMVL